jgi:ABC-type transport system involved in multi-copper enzyme maturation permease subunit
VIAAEWLKFATVRGWVIAVVVAAAAVAGFGLAGGQQGTCRGDTCAPLRGPGGEAVSDSFYFVHQTLTGNGTITVRAGTLASTVPGPGPGTAASRVTVPWSKAGIILKAGLAPGSPYAAIMVTAGHGVRLQDNYTGDIAGPDLNAAWLRLVRSGPAVTGYASADGRTWTKVGTVALPGLPGTVAGGMFAASPGYTQTAVGVSQVTGSPSQSTAVFQDVALSWPARPWAGTSVGGPQDVIPGQPAGYRQRGGTYTVTGSGDIAPVTDGPSGLGATLTQTLGGVFVALIILAVVGTVFITAEYRRGLILLTLAACPRRGRVLAAKAAVIGLTAFAAGLAGAAVAVTAGSAALRGHGVYLPPVTTLTEVRVIAGVAAVLALCAVLALAVGTVLRRGAVAVTAVVTLIALPYVLSVPVPVLPLAAADWLMRVSPAAAFAVEQTVTRYPQVDEVYAPAYGYFPLSPGAGLAVLCAWTAAGLALAYWTLRRRQA